MFKSLIKGAIIGGIIAWIWSVVSWMVIPWHQPLFHKFQSENYLASMIKENTEEKGIYLLPYMDVEGKKNTKSEQEQFNQKLKRGPVVFAVVNPKGVSPMGIGHFICSFITQLVAGAFIGMILYLSCCTNYCARVMIVLFTGIFTGIVTFIPAMIWWHFPLGYTVVSFLDIVIAWLLAGLVLALFFKSNKECSSPCHKEKDIPPPAT